MNIDFNDPVWSIPKWLEQNGNNWLFVVTLFTIAQLINVILSTFKSVIIIKGSKNTAVLVNTISYSISAFITAVIGSVVKNVPITVIITAITNAVGVWVGLTIIDKMRKERVWKISGTVKAELWDDLRRDLITNQIHFIPLETSWDKRRVLDVYSESRQESILIGRIFKKYNVKYMILEAHNSLY